MDISGSASAAKIHLYLLQFFLDKHIEGAVVLCF